MVIDFKTRKVISTDNDPEILTIGNLVSYLNSFGQDLQQVLDFQIISGDHVAKTVELTPEGLIIK